MKKYQCPCCGYFTYNIPANEDCGYICPVCFWENDPLFVHQKVMKKEVHNKQLPACQAEKSGIGGEDYEKEISFSVKYNIYNSNFCWSRICSLKWRKS